MPQTVEIEGHTSRAFDGALSALHVRVVEMGGLVLLQVREAANAYTDWDQAVARRVIEREREVNRYDLAVDEESLTLIARRQPVASDLRAVIALSKVVAELERAGDESKKIALTVLGRAGRVGERPGPATARDARHLARLAVNMVRLGLDALDVLDVGKAREVVTLDRELDTEYADGMRRLLTRAMEDARNFSVALEAAFVLKSLERIGDHARNIARYVLSMSGAADARQAQQPQLPLNESPQASPQP
jgi:phosphate transport system protein